MQTTNRLLADQFKQFADRLEAQRDNPYRVKAYRKAADSLLNLHEDVGELARRGALRLIPGIGKDLASKIEAFLRTGSLPLDAPADPLPSEVDEWSRLPGLSPALIRHLYFHLGMRTLEDLEALARSHLLRTWPGWTIASEEALLRAIEERKRPVTAEEKSPQP